MAIKTDSESKRDEPDSLCPFLLTLSQILFEVIDNSGNRGKSRFMKYKEFVEIESVSIIEASIYN